MKSEVLDVNDCMLDCGLFTDARDISHRCCLSFTDLAKPKTQWLSDICLTWSA